MSYLVSYLSCIACIIYIHYSHCCLLVRDAVYYGRRLLIFRINIPPPASGMKKAYFVNHKVRKTGLGNEKFDWRRKTERDTNGKNT